jgi:D-alanine-D-alanine ligase
MIRVGVLRGGASNKYDESLATGAYVLKNLPRDRYEPVDIFVDRAGDWHLGGVTVTEDKLKLRVDMIWNALHGFYGEDGKVQQTLESLGIPYLGSDPLASAVTMNKKLSKDYLSKRGIKTPRGVYVEDWGDGGREESVTEVVHNVSKKLSPPWIVEPISRPQGDGASRAKTRDELTAILLHMIDADIPVLIEEAVIGKEVSVDTVSGFRGKHDYTFLPVVKNNSGMRVKKDESIALQKTARDVHKAFGLGHYSRIDTVVTPKGHVYVLSVDTVPRLHEQSDLHHSLREVGSSFDEFARHIIEMAMKK